MKSEIAARVANLSPSQFERLSHRLGENKARGIIAYVASMQTDEQTVGALLAHARDHLPDYMVPVDVVLVSELPRLPNGKVDRSALPSMALRAETSTAATPIGPTERSIAEIWTSVLGVSPINRSDNFFEIGGDSILSIQAVSRARLAGLRMEATDLFSYPILSDLAGAIDAAARSMHNPDGVTRPDGDQVLLPLTPIQQWFFETHFDHLDQWNQVVYLEVDRSIDREIVLKAIRLLPSRHDALRQLFKMEDERWGITIVADLDDDPVQFVDLSGTIDIEKGVQNHIAQDNRGLNLTNGPLFKIAVFDRGNGMPWLISISAHHLLIDNVSAGLLRNDVDFVCTELVARRVPRPNESLTFAVWARHLDQFARSEILQRELTYWREVDAIECLSHIRTSDDFGLEGESTVIIVGLSHTSTRELLETAIRAYNTRTNEILLAALWQTISASTDSPRVTLGLERHGRQVLDGLDPSTTVGWMTAFFPITLRSAKGITNSEAIREMKETVRAVPNGGVGYGLLHYCGDRSYKNAARPSNPEIIFNYLGNPESSGSDKIRLVKGPQDSARTARSNRHSLVDVNCWLEDDRLMTSWSFAATAVRPEIVQLWPDYFLERLDELIEHCRGLTKTMFTPSDFPQSEMNQKELDSFLDGLD